MNNYYTLIYLNRELNGNIAGGEFLFAISPHKDVLECYIDTGAKRHRLVFSANPEETTLFLDNYRPPKKRNVVEFFEQLQGEVIEKMTLAEYDRLISVWFRNGCQLLFKLFGNSANAMLVNNGTVLDAFKHPEQIRGEKAPEPVSPEFEQKITGKAKPKNELTKRNPLLPRNLLPPLIEQHNVDAMSVEETKAFSQEITDAMIDDPHPRVLKNGDFTLWSEEWLSLPTEKAFDSVNEGVLYAYRNAVHLRRLHNKKERLLHFLQRAVSKKQAQYRQLQQAERSLERADEYEKYGHLLMANAHESVKPGTGSIEIEDFYNNNELIEIDLKEDLSIADNAGRYYKKAKSSRKSYKKAKQRAPNVKKEMEEAEELLSEVEGITKLHELQDWMKDKSDELKTFGFGTEDEGQAVSPFRKFKVGKYEIWIGKNAKSNDKLTSHAHKEDIWLHARGVSGSHAVIRMGNESSYPPKEVIVRAASYAAWYSKAKGMKTAPVMYTKRKYVYKPSGGAPGAVVLKREEVVMVPPQKPE